jgi:hypothetical protein
MKPAPEIVQWELAINTFIPKDLFDFRVHRRSHWGSLPYHYRIEAKSRDRIGLSTYTIADFATTTPLNNELRDRCINLARFSL